jgi:peptide/nickel transport system substrate-binding protein
MNRTKSTRAVAVLLGMTVVAAACGSSAKKADTTTTAAASTATTVAGATTVPGTTVAVATTVAGKPLPTVIYAQEEEGTKYNNNTGAANSFANTVVNNLIQPFVYLTTDKLAFELNKDLMVSVEVTSKDPQVVTYKINPKAVWEDGVAIDCKDFYYTYMSLNGKVQMANPDFAPGKKDDKGADIPEKLPVFDAASTTGYEQMKSVECSDGGKTVVTTYDTPFADYKALFGSLIPAHLTESKTGIADLTKIDATKDSPEIEKIGKFFNEGMANFDKATSLSGMWYSVKEYTKDTGITLVKNPKYYGTPAVADTIILKTVTDAQAQAQALENGELQAIQPQADPAVADALRKAKGVKFIPASGLTFEHLDFNFNNPVLADKAVRQAFALCVDRQDIIDKLVGPVNPDAKPMDSLIFVPSQVGYTPHLGDFSKFDLTKSASVLDAGGWVKAADGSRSKDGKKLAFRISHKGIQRRSDTTQNIIASCKKVGFDITEDSDKKFNAARLPKGDFDVALFAWVGQPTLSAAYGIYTPDGGSNYQGYKNAQVKTLYDQANKEFDDTKRLDLMNQIDKTILDDMASLPLFQLPEMPAYSDKITNVIFNGPLGLTWNGNTWASA